MLSAIVGKLSNTKMKKKPIRIRHVNSVDLTKTFSAHLCGGSRGFDGANALESYSNDIAPCIKTLIGFVLVVEVEDEQDNRSEGSRP